MADTTPGTELEIANGSYLQYLETGDSAYVDNMKPDEMRAFIRDLGDRDRAKNVARPGRGEEPDFTRLVATVLVDLIEHFGDLDDTEEPPFGEFAKIRPHADLRGLTVFHQSEPWGISIDLSPVRED